MDTRVFGKEGKLTKRIKRITTNTKSQQAKVEKQRKAQKKKTFVPGTLDTRPTTVYDRNNPGKGKDSRPKYKSYQRPTESEKYKKPETKSVTTAKKDYKSIGPDFDNVPKTTTTTPKVNDTTQVKQHSVSKDTEKDLNKAKDKGKSNALKAFEMAQGLLKRPTSR